MGFSMQSTKQPRSWVIDSHRGAFKNGLLENSVPAYLESIREGANALECDVRRTLDGELVLVHNRTIDHISKFATQIPNASEFNEPHLGRVGLHTLRYLKALKFPNEGEIMTIGEFLAFLKKHCVGAQIELKEMKRVLPKLLDEIARANIDYTNQVAPVVVTSFNWVAILKLRRLLLKRSDIPRYKYPDTPGLALGLQALKLTGAFGRWILRRCQNRDIWGFMTYYKYLPSKMIQYAHQCGVKFCPRVPDNKDLVMEYIQAGVDGFETDNIGFIRQCISEAGFESPVIPTL